MDEYIIENNGLSLTYLKNEKIHREVGPAMFFIEDKHKYNIEEDKHLYEEIKCEFSLYSDIVMTLQANSMNLEQYYLDGVEYSKEEFNIIMLEKELNKELPEKEFKTKKLKI